MRTAVIQTRVDTVLKHDADNFFESIGTFQNANGKRTAFNS